MGKKTCLIVFALSLLLSGTAQEKYVAEYDIDDISPELILGANVVVRHDEQNLEIIDKEDAKLTIRQAVTILNEEGAEEDGRIEIYYDNFYFKIGELKAAIYDKRGRLVEKLKKKDFADIGQGSFEVSDSRVLAYEATVRDYPYTIYLDYTMKLSGLAFLPRWYPIDRTKKSIQSGTFTVRTPEALDIRYKLFGGIEEGTKEKNDGIISYNWKIENQSPLAYEPYSSVIQTPGILLGANEFEIDGYEGKGGSWKDYGLFFYTLNLGREKIDPSLASQVKEMTSLASTNYEKINILYKYLQENTRYMSIQLGIGGFQSIPAQKTAKTGYGDCKGLTYFMKGMLAEIDIPSYACLIYRGVSPPYFHTDFVTSQFNHVLLCVPQGKDTIWVECTNDDIPAGYLSMDDYDRPILMLTEDGGLLRRTPTPNPEDNRQIRTATVKLQEQGAADANVETLFTGTQQDFPRAMTTQTDQRYREKWLMNRLKLPNVEIKSLAIAKSEDSPQCTINYHIASRKWAKSSGTRLFLRLHQLEGSTSVPPKDEKREKPIVWKPTFMDQDSIYFDLPEGYIIESMGEAKTLIERPYGHYKHEIKVTDEGDLIYLREWKLDKCFLEPDEYEEFRKFFLEVRKADQKQVVLNKRS